MSAHRRPVYFNPGAKQWIADPAPSGGSAVAFHRQLPNYKATSLTRLDSLAVELGIGQLLVKDESNRFRLPSFKILGASWGAFQAVVQHLRLDPGADLEVIREALSQRPVTLYAATDGNHGRAVARMGTVLSIPVKVYVPVGLDAAAIDRVRSEKATVIMSKGSYDDAVLEAYEAAGKEGGILVQDTAFEGYEDIPKWIVEGYSTMMHEIDQDLGEKNVDLVITPAGVGSLSQAVVSHYKKQEKSTAVMTVEADTAACLWKSLTQGKCAPIKTSHTIMSGLDCGTVSTLAWPILQSGVDASATVSDYEAHQAVLDLKACGVSAGPCGAAALAALRRLSESDRSYLGLDESSTVVLLCTEGEREHDNPISVSSDDPVTLTQQLVQIDSSSPALGSRPGPGETAIARFVTAWLEHRGVESHWIEPTKGRPSVVGVVRGSGGGKNLMLNGHIDTVTLLGYDGDALSGKIEGKKLYGRGAADMKCGVAAAMTALVRSRDLALRGDVIFTGVADEEAESIGTEQVLQAGWRADGAIVNEPTNLDMIYTHKGFVWLEVDIHGVAAHGSRPDQGVDAISKAGYFLVELDKYAQRLQQVPCDPSVGGPSVHASLIRGGEEASSYPARCTVVVERRTVSGETPAQVKLEIQQLLQTVSHAVADFSFDVCVTFDRPPFAISQTHPFVELVKGHVATALGTPPVVRGETFWTDCALLAAEGIPALLWGPRGEGLHAKEEWVDVDSIHVVADALTAVAGDFCR